MLEDHIGQVHRAVDADRGQHVERILQVIVDSVAFVLRGAERADEPDVFAGEDRERAEVIADEGVVHVNEGEAVREAAELAEHGAIPAAGAHDHVVVQQHHEVAVRRGQAGIVQFPHRAAGQPGFDSHLERKRRHRRRSIIGIDDEDDLERMRIAGGIGEAAKEPRERCGAAAGRNDQ
jgi:hypothetical protein